MEIIEKKYISLTKALNTLKESLAIIEDPKNQHLYESLRDSVIQRFEYSIDTFWKFLKLYIQEKEKTDLEVGSYPQLRFYTPGSPCEEKRNMG